MKTLLTLCIHVDAQLGPVWTDGCWTRWPFSGSVFFYWNVVCLLPPRVLGERGSLLCVWLPASSQQPVCLQPAALPVLMSGDSLPFSPHKFTHSSVSPRGDVTVKSPVTSHSQVLYLTLLAAGVAAVQWCSGNPDVDTNKQPASAIDPLKISLKIRMKMFREASVAFRAYLAK